MYIFALRVLTDWEEAEVWSVMFDTVAMKVLGFHANTYSALTSDAERYNALSLLRGARVMVTIKKSTKDTYVNYTVSAPELSLYEQTLTKFSFLSI